MRKYILILIISLIVFGCQTKSRTDYFSLSIGSHSLIKFHISNYLKPIYYTVYYNSTLPFGQIVKNYSIISDTIFDLNIELNYPVQIYLRDSSEIAEFFVLPNDTLHIFIDLKKETFKNSIQFKGTTVDISEYLTKTKFHFNFSPDKNQSPQEFNNMIDSLYAIALGQLDSLKYLGKLPNWYIDFAKTDTYYEKENCKLDQYSQRYWMYKQFLPRIEGYVDKIDFRLIDKYYFSDYCIQLLTSIHADKYDTILFPQYVSDDIFLNFCQDNIDAVKDKLSAPARSYFVASKASILFWEKKFLRLNKLDFNFYTNKIDSFIAVNSALIEDTMILGLINEKKDQVYQNYRMQSILKPGTKAPGFYLVDIHSQIVQIEDFKNKLILLNFWGTYCAPCIKSIPLKNQLVADYDSGKFVLINICTDYNVSKWKDIIENNSFKGIHLICKENWNDLLRSNYNIYSVPHYTLIDQNGNLILNNLSKDSINSYISKNI